MGRLLLFFSLGLGITSTIHILKPTTTPDYLLFSVGALLVGVAGIIGGAYIIFRKPHDS